VEKRIVPGGFLSLAFRAHLQRAALNQGQDQLAQSEQVARRVVAATLAGIFGKGHVQVPVLLIFDALVPTHVTREDRGTSLAQGRERVAGGPYAHQLHRGLSPARGGTPQLLAINDQVPTHQQTHGVLPPLGEAAFEFDGVQVPKDAVERVVKEDARRQGHELAQHRFFVAGVIVDVIVDLLKRLAIGQ